MPPDVWYPHAEEARRLLREFFSLNKRGNQVNYGIDLHKGKRFEQVRAWLQRDREMRG